MQELPDPPTPELAGQEAITQLSPQHWRRRRNVDWSSKRTSRSGGSTTRAAGAVRDNEGLNHMFAAPTALGRVCLPDDIGGAMPTLLAPESKWINGQRIEVSGGMFL